MALYELDRDQLPDNAAAVLQQLDTLPMTSFKAVLAQAKPLLTALPAHELLCEPTWPNSMSYEQYKAQPRPARIGLKDHFRSVQKRALLRDLPGVAKIWVANATNGGVLAMSMAAALALVDAAK